MQPATAYSSPHFRNGHPKNNCGHPPDVQASCCAAPLPPPLSPAPAVHAVESKSNQQGSIMVSGKCDTHRPLAEPAGRQFRFKGMQIGKYACDRKVMHIALTVRIYCIYFKGSLQQHLLIQSVCSADERAGHCSRWLAKASFPDLHGPEWGMQAVGVVEAISCLGANGARVREG